MPLTPDDVRNKRFTPVRLREGYDMAEVDAFLDEVEAELIRLAEEGERAPSDRRRGAVCLRRLRRSGP
jgi:DivIVA domain-containing protein